MASRSPLRIARRGDPSEDAVVACFRERVLAACDDRVERIVLFGSRARGDDHAGSDWDFAVLFECAPTEREERSLSELTWVVRHELDTEIQAIARPGRTWRGTDELSCDIREHGVVIHGLCEAPMIERPILQHARAALGKAERFAAPADQAVPHAYETIVHNSYYAMFHAARAALLAVEGSASTSHGRVVQTFAGMVKGRRMKGGREHATNLNAAFELRMKADYSNEDLTETGRQLRDQVRPFLEFCRELVERAAPGE